MFCNFDEFSAYINAKYTPHSIIQLTSYFKKHLNEREFQNPLALYIYIKSKTAGKTPITKTARAYLNFCEQNELLPKYIIDKYRQVLKVERGTPDFHVPSDKEVIENYLKVKHNPNLELVYLVLATSGIRYIECLDFLKSYNPDKFVVNSDFVSYSVSELRHFKNINNIYLPLFVYEKLQKINNTYHALRQRFKDKDCTFSLKYLRKWNYNFLLYNQVPESVADFIQGRANSSVSSNHYLAKSQQAVFWYAKILPLLKKLFLE